MNITDLRDKCNKVRAAGLATELRLGKDGSYAKNYGLVIKNQDLAKLLDLWEAAKLWVGDEETSIEVLDAALAALENDK